MREENAKRKLDKRLDSRLRDPSGNTGNANGFHKMMRSYGRALIDSSLNEMAEDEAEALEPCIMCGIPCVSVCCSNSCSREAVRIGVIKPDSVS